MRIQIFVQSLSIGGAERVAALWANGFVKRGHQVGVVLSRPLNFPRTYNVDDSIKISSINSVKKGKIRSFLCRFRKTGREIKSFKPDVIITVYHVEDVAIWFFTRFTKTKIISTEHNSFERPVNAPMGKRDYRLKFCFNKFFDAVTVLTQADRDFIGNKLKNVFVLPNPLAYEAITTPFERKKIIMAVGRLEAHYVKGFDILINAYAGMSQKYPEWRLRIVGSGIDGGASLSYLKELAKAAKIEAKVDFVDYQKNILPFFRECEIFVLSSRYEGFGLVLIEAMSQGCACVACDYKGRQKEIVKSDEYGIVCPPEDTEALQKALEKLVVDELMRKKIQEKAPQRAKEYAPDKIMDKWDDILQKVGANDIPYI